MSRPLDVAWLPQPRSAVNPPRTSQPTPQGPGRSPLSTSNTPVDQRSVATITLQASCPVNRAVAAVPVPADKRRPLTDAPKSSRGSNETTSSAATSNPSSRRAACALSSSSSTPVDRSTAAVLRPLRSCPDGRTVQATSSNAAVNRQTPKPSPQGAERSSSSSNTSADRSTAAVLSSSRSCPDGRAVPVTPSNAAVNRQTSPQSSLDKQLRVRLQKLRLPKDEICRNKEIVNILVSNIRDELTKNSHHQFKNWETMNSGSYYDKTKIKKPDEYDCMFTCQIRSKCVYHPSSPSKSYAGLRILTSSNWEPSELLTSFGNDSFICPKAFKRYFREHVESALRCSQPKGKEIVIRHDDGKGPAVTLDVKHARSHIVVFSVDLVPAVRLLDWPDPAKNWTSCWLSRDDVSRIKECLDYRDSVKPFVVPKIHPTEYSTMEGQCRWWRLSFSAIEKEIVKHADGTYSSSQGQTCRKDVLRLLKDDLAMFYENNQQSEKIVCSYFMKSIVLRLWEEERSWDITDLLPRYVNALQTTVSCLFNQNIQHFFIENENLLDEKEMSAKELNRIERYFESLLKRYRV